MKTRLILTAMAMFVLHTVFGQDIKFDFQNKKLNTNRVKNQNFTFMISNINTFKYKVSVNGELLNYHMEKQTDFEALFIKLAKENNLAKEEKYDSTATPLKNYKDNLSDYKNAYNKLIKVNLFYKDLQSLTTSNLPADKILDKKKKKYEFYINQNAADSSSKILEFYSDYYFQIKNSAQLLKTQAKQQEKEDTVLIDSIFQNAKKIYSSGNIVELAKLYQEIDKSRFNYYYFQAKPDADEIKLHISLVNKKDNNKEDITVPLIVTGGVKIDFSGGLFTSNLANHEYISMPFYKNDSLSGYQLVKKFKPRSFGAATYMHVYIRNRWIVNGAFSLGLGLDQDMNMHIMPGLSLIMGNKQRLIISGGLDFSKIDMLSPNYSENTIYSKEIKPDYVKEYRFGWFVGISYNIFKANKK